MATDEAEPVEFADLAADTARRAGSLLLERFREQPTGIQTKSSSTDMVSDADSASESLILDAIREARPNDAILGEESGSHVGTSGFRWIVDPLDGTTNFLYRHKAWCVSIAALHGDRGVAAAIYAPCDDELFVAAVGDGATCNGEALSVSQTSGLSTALIATGFAYDSQNRALQGRLVASLVPHVRDIRRGGSAALDLAWLATGRLDGYYEAPINEWDVAAGKILTSEAGGICRPLLGPSGVTDGVVAAGPNLIDALSVLVAEVGKSENP